MRTNGARMALGAAVLTALVVPVSGLGASAHDRLLARADHGGRRTVHRPKIVDAIPVGSSPTVVAVDSGSVWVTNFGDDTISRIDSSTGSVVATISVGSRPDGIAAGEGSVWVANSGSRSVWRIDPTTDAVIAKVRVGADPEFAAVADGAVWVPNTNDGTLSRIDVATNTVVATIHVGKRPISAAVGDGAVWVANRGSNSISRVDPATNTVVASIHTRRPDWVAFGEGAVWVASYQTHRVTRIDPATNTVTAAIRINGYPAAVAVGAGAVWVSDQRSGAVIEIDPATNRQLSRFRVGKTPIGLAVGDGSVWIADVDQDAVERIQLAQPAPRCTVPVQSVGRDTATRIPLPCSNPGGGAITLTVIAPPKHGSLGSIDQSGQAVVYTPAAGYSGADSFAFAASNGESDSEPVSVAIRVAAAPDTVGPSVQLPAGTVRLSRDGRLRPLLSCPVTETQGCTGTLTLATPGPTSALILDEVPFRAAGGQRVVLVLSLSPQGDSLISQAKLLPATLIAVARDGAGNLGTTTTSVTLAEPEPAIAFVSDAGISIMDDDGSTKGPLTADRPLDTRPVWSPDGRSIAFICDFQGQHPENVEFGLTGFARNSGGEICSIGAAGDGLRQLTSTGGWVVAPAWSPDGTRIAYVNTSANARGGIYVMNADGSGQRQLTRHWGDDFPTWSPDGRKIAFTSERESEPDLWVMNADGSAQTRLAGTPGFDLGPSWSPDGRQLAFTSYPPSAKPRRELWVVSSDGTNESLLFSGRFFAGSGFDVVPRWSPDSSTIAFTVEERRRFLIDLVRRDGELVRQLTPTGADDAFPAWSPDGKQIACESYVAGNLDIYVANADGSGRARLTANPGFDGLPAWQPAG